MGKRIDRALLLALFSCLCFFALSCFVPSIPLCAALAYLAGAALYRSVLRLPPGARRKKRLRLQAAEACLSEAIYQRAHGELLRRALPEGTLLLYRLPESELSREEVLSLWRSAPPGTLTLATTGRVSRRTSDWAQTLSSPSVRLIGREELLRLVAACEGFDPQSFRHARPDRRERLRQALLHSRLSPRGVLTYACVLLALYLLLGRRMYLACALCLIALGALKAHVRRGEGAS